jgi:hypothetical protein
MGVIVSKSTGGGPTAPTSSLLLYTENIQSPSPPTALGFDSIALGSAAQTSTSGVHSLAIGEQSLSRIPGGVVQASGRFASSGDAQAGKYLLRTHTVNNTETELFIDGTGGSTRLLMPDDSTWTFKGMVTGHRTDAVGGHAGFSFEGVIYRVAGVSSIAFQGQPSLNVIARSDSSWGVKLYADNTHGSLTIACVGQIGKTIRWVAVVETLEVTN